MTKILLVLTALLAAGVALVRFFPDEVMPLIDGTPLEKLAADSKPMYQWRDESGGLQVTDEPPPDGVPYEVKQYALDANLMPSYKMESE